MMSNLSDTLCGMNPQRIITFFDKVALRMDRALTDKQLQYLRKNARSVDIRPGRPIRGSDLKLILTVVVPNDAALRFLAERSGLVVNYVELALDVSFRGEDETRSVHALLDQSFVQSRHGTQQTVQYGAATYTGQRRPGRSFVWYSDKSSKRTNDPNILHIEARIRGMDAVRRAGIHEPRDLIKFDHAAYLRSNLQLFVVDLERLGRCYQNRESGQRRQKTWIHQSRSFKYNIDRSTGAALFRAYATHPIQQLRSVQRFVDQFGRGPFLQRIDVSKFLPRSHTSSLFISGNHPRSGNS